MKPVAADVNGLILSHSEARASLRRLRPLAAATRE